MEKKFGKTTINALIDNGRLKIVSGINDVLLSPLPQELKNSQKNTKTGFIVPDELAHEGNTTGCIAVFHPAVTGEIPSGEIVVLPGHHRPFIHSGKGAKHLTGSVIEDPKRNLFPQEELAVIMVIKRFFMPKPTQSTMPVKSLAVGFFVTVIFM